MGHRAFSLLEVVLVVAIVAVFAAIAVPRVGRGTKGGSEAALAGDLRVLRGAIDRYAVEHGGSFPTNADIVKQLTRYSDLNGGTLPVKDATHIYGPYLRSVPPLPVGLKKGAIGIDEESKAGSGGVGWIYDETTGAIRANCTDAELDSRDIRYNSY